MERPPLKFHGDRDILGYSKHCTISAERLAKLKQKLKRNVTIDRVEQLEGKKFDVVIADPPYGINTDEDLEELARLYADGLRAMIRSLRPGGQLVVCLADRIHTGRQSLFFTHKELVVKQVVNCARELGLSVVAPEEHLTHMGNFFAPPYYWESSRALRRAILHFRFEKAP